MAEEKPNEVKGEGTPLEVANAYEREVQLRGRANPDKFKMGDGSTLSETRRKAYESQVKEGEGNAKAQAARMREQSVEGDPLYAEGAKVVSTNGAATIIPASEPAKPKAEEHKTEGAGTPLPPEVPV